MYPALLVPKNKKLHQDKEVRIINEKLLRRLIELTKLPFISDLPDSTSRQSISKALNEIKPGEYALEEWEYAIGYILGQTQPHFETAEAALQYFHEQLDMVNE